MGGVSGALSRRAWWLPFVVVLMAAAIVLAACGDDDDDDDDEDGGSPVATRTAAADDTPPASGDDEDDGDGEISGDLDPCGLMSSDEAAGLIGEPVGDPEREEQGPFILCRWAAESEDSFKSVQVGYFDFDVDDDEFREIVDAGGSIEPEELSDVGAEAFWAEVQVFVRVDGRVFSIIADSPEEAFSRDASIEGAKLVVENLD